MRVPGPETDPRETMEWVRRGELIAGVGCTAFGFVFWNEGWWHWLLIGLGVFSVLPWGGARTVLRMADKNPDVLVRDPAQRRERARRFAKVSPPAYALLGFGLGYLMGGWGVAIFVGAMVGVSALAASWWILRRT